METQLHAAHAARWATIDPALPVPPPLELEDHDAVLEVASAAGQAVGRARWFSFAPDDEFALWGSLRGLALRSQLAPAEGDAAPLFDALLARLDDVAIERAVPGDDDATLVVPVPSRDTALVVPLVRRGYAPLLVTALRRAPAVPSSPPADPGGAVRPATDADLPAVAALATELHATDASFGAVRHRPEAAGILERSVTTQFCAAPELTWVAEQDGEVVGFVQAQAPEQAEWVASKVGLDPVAYLGYLHVRPEARGRGLGQLLVGHAHAALDAAGVAATILDHALPSPLSTPFWARAGYRPLFTTWQRRPALRRAAPPRSGDH